jgi:hypothetical protein
MNEEDDDLNMSNKFASPSYHENFINEVDVQLKLK